MKKLHKTLLAGVLMTCAAGAFATTFHGDAKPDHEPKGEPQHGMQHPPMTPPVLYFNNFRRYGSVIYKPPLVNRNSPYRNA